MAVLTRQQLESMYSGRDPGYIENLWSRYSSGQWAPSGYEKYTQSAIQEQPKPTEPKIEPITPTPTPTPPIQTTPTPSTPIPPQRTEAELASAKEALKKGYISQEEYNKAIGQQPTPPPPTPTQPAMTLRQRADQIGFKGFSDEQLKEIVSRGQEDPLYKMLVTNQNISDIAQYKPTEQITPTEPTPPTEPIAPTQIKKTDALTALSQGASSLLDQVLLQSKDQRNLQQYSWWSASPNKQETWGYLQDFVNNPQKMADYVLSKGLTNLQSYAWWNTSPVKEQAWQIIQQSKTTEEPLIVSEKQEPFETPPDVKLPEVTGINMADIFGYNALDSIGNIDLTQIYENTGITQLQKTLDEMTITYNQVTSKIQEQIDAENADYETKRAEINYNPLELRTTRAMQLKRIEDRHNAKIEKYSEQLKSANETYKSAVSDAKEMTKMQQDAIQKYIDNTIKIAEYKRGIMKDVMAEQRSIRDDSRALMNTMVDAVGASALLLPGMDKVMADAGISGMDFTMMSDAITAKEKREILKSASPFSAWLMARDSGDISTMKAIEQWQIMTKESGYSTASYWLGGQNINVSTIDEILQKAPKECLAPGGCVYFTRWQMSGERSINDSNVMPLGLWTMQDKMNIVNSYIPVAGGAAIIGNPNQPQSTGHLAFVMSVNGDQMTIRENMEGKIRERTIPVSSAYGFYIPNNLSNGMTGSYPRIDAEFPAQYAKYVQGLITYNQLYSYFTSGVKNENDKREIVKAIDSKFQETEIKWNVMTDAQKQEWLRNNPDLSRELVTSMTTPQLRYPAVIEDEGTRTAQLIQDTINNPPAWILDSYKNRREDGTMEVIDEDGKKYQVTLEEFVESQYDNWLSTEKKQLIDSIKRLS